MPFVAPLWKAPIAEETLGHRRNPESPVSHRPLPSLVRSVCLAVALAVGSFCASAAALAPDAVIEAGQRLNQTAMAGSASAITQAEAYFAEQVAAHPGDPLLRAYYGASHSRLATTTLLPWRKMSLTEDGLAEIDKALALLGPDHAAAIRRGVSVDLETRFVAASTFLSLPEMFHRKERGQKLLNEVLSHPGFERSPAPFKAAVWSRAASAAQSDGRVADEQHFLKLAAQARSAPAASAATPTKDKP